MPTYLAFAGGIDVPVVTGSDTNPKMCIWRVAGGRALKAGDVLEA